MNYPVLKGVSYALIHAADMILHQGSAANSERRLNPESEYLEEIPKNLRTFEEVVKYPPNQAYIGAISPDELDAIQRPWYKNQMAAAKREGEHGEIMPLDEFLGLMKAVDVFDLVLLEECFQKGIAAVLKAHPLLGSDSPFAWRSLDKLDKNPASKQEISDLIEGQQAEPMYFAGELVGCVKKAHAFDPALSQHVMFENLVSKASAAFCLQLLFAKSGLKPTEVDYIIECSEEACGDMNQRGGGNFAKAIGEVCGCLKATGSDTRGFCAAPVHALVIAASLVQSGVYKNVVVVAGGSSAKLGMNGKDHVKNDMPILEDVLGAFAVHVTAKDDSDKLSPIIRTDAVGRHSIGTGSSPQAVTQSIIADPLDRLGLKLSDVDCFSVEMQNPELTEPAKAGDVPKANYKMIAALGVMRKEFERSELNKVVEGIAVPGFAPTQGHIPSGVPLLGHCLDMIKAGKMRRAMIVGKGSLFLGRLTNLFDGVSFLIEEQGQDLGDSVPKPLQGTSPLTLSSVRVGLTLLGSEHGEEEILLGAEMVDDPAIELVLIGSAAKTELRLIEAANEKDAHNIMDEMLRNGELDAAVTMHYNFPIGVSTVGRVVSPSRGRRMYIANTTGTSDTERVPALLKNTIQAIAVAKACGKARPTVGILNIDGARSLERGLISLKENGYDINFTESARSDGGVIMRGNDLLQGVSDIMVMDSLTGNVVMKTMSAFTSGGDYEASGDGYGPGVGEGFGKIVNIISRASGAPVVKGAIAFAAACAQGMLVNKINEEFYAARKAGLDELIRSFNVSETEQAEEIEMPPEKVLTEEIAGIEILELEDAVRVLWKKGIYASSGMGCSGPLIMVATDDLDIAIDTLEEAGYI